MRQAEVRYYFDADILGLARVVCAPFGLLIKSLRHQRPLTRIATTQLGHDSWPEVIPLLHA